MQVKFWSFLRNIHTGYHYPNGAILTKSYCTSHFSQNCLKLHFTKIIKSFHEMPMLIK